MPKSIQKAHREGRKFSSKTLILDEMNRVVPSSKEKIEHIKKTHKNYIEKQN